MKKNDQFAVNSLFDQWIPKVGPRQYLITERGTEYLNSEMAKSTLFKTRQPPRSSLAPGSNGTVEVQIINLGTHLRMFLHDTPENWSIQVHFFACAHKCQPLSVHEIPPYEVFSYATAFSGDFLITYLSIFFTKVLHNTVLLYILFLITNKPILFRCCRTAF